MRQKKNILLVIIYLLAGMFIIHRLRAQIGLGTTQVANSASSAAGGTCGTLGGDLSGTCTTATVAKINGVGLGTTTATSANILIADGTNWITRAVSGDITITNTGAATVGKINGATLGTTTATSGNILIGSGTTWVTNALSGDATITSTGVATVAKINNNFPTFYITYKAGVCQGATGSIGFSTPSAGAPTAACVTGSNTNYGVAQFDDATSESVQDHFTLPPDWTGAIDLQGYWRTTATTGNAVWQIQTTCVANAETGDPAFNAVQKITDAALGTTQQFNTFSQATVTVTGCAAGEEFFFKFFRDPADAGDTLGATAELITLRWTIRRTN